MFLVKMVLLVLSIKQMLVAYLKMSHSLVNLLVLVTKAGILVVLPVKFGEGISNTLM